MSEDPDRATFEACFGVLEQCWARLGPVSVGLTWTFAAPVSLRPPLASRLRSAIGPALAAACPHSSMLNSIPGEGPPAAWFGGWDIPGPQATAVSAELTTVSAVLGDWANLFDALSILELPAAQPGTGLLVPTTLTLRSLSGARLGPQDLPPPLELPRPLPRATECLVEAITPLQLRSSGGRVAGPPHLSVLVRSAGERLRQLSERWGRVHGLPSVVGEATRQAGTAALEWFQDGEKTASRWSSRTGLRQDFRGPVGLFAYRDVAPLCRAFLGVAALLGVGKGTAFGCGKVRVFEAE